MRFSGSKQVGFIWTSPALIYLIYLQPLAKKDKERELKKKNAELQSKVENLEKKCAVLEVSASTYCLKGRGSHFSACA